MLDTNLTDVSLCLFAAVFAVVVVFNKNPVVAAFYRYGYTLLYSLPGLERPG